MAWLHTHPEAGDGKPDALSRMQQIERDGGTPQLPPVTAQYLCDALLSVGLCQPGAMGGAMPLAATELAAWCQGTATPLAPWEFAAVLAASKAYCAQMCSKDTAPPFGDLEDMADPEVVTARLRAGLSSLARPRRKKAH